MESGHSRERKLNTSHLKGIHLQRSINSYAERQAPACWARTCLGDQRSENAAGSDSLLTRTMFHVCFTNEFSVQGRKKSVVQIIVWSGCSTVHGWPGMPAYNFTTCSQRGQLSRTATRRRVQSHLSNKVLSVLLVLSPIYHHFTSRFMKSTCLVRH